MCIRDSFETLRTDHAFALEYARHTAAAVGRTRVVVDVAGLTVGY